MRVERINRIILNMETTTTAGKFPTRRPCGTCATVKGKLRKECPYCHRPVCSPCYGPDHALACKLAQSIDRAGAR